LPKLADVGEGNGPVASEVVQRRLRELFAQLQTPVAAEPVAAGAEEESGEIDEQQWLERLRPSADAAEPSNDPQPSVLSGLPGRVVTFTREHLATVVVVLLVGVAWTAYSLLQVRSTPVADAAPRVETSPSASGAQSPAASPSGPPAAGRVRVHVIGAVTHPGVVELSDGARVADAIAAAGGLGPSAAVGELNLAQKVIDGTQLKIGTKAHPGAWIRDGATPASSGGGSPGGGSGGSGGATKVSLNSATLQQLDALPGIGPVTAQKILDWRKEHGRFTAITELQEVDGIGPKTYADLADRVQL
jgi:competence protein ComEA